MSPVAPGLDVHQTTELADDLIRQLAEHVGDDDKVCEVLRRWLDVLDVRGLSYVAMAALRTTFGECISTIPAGPGQAGFKTEGLDA